MYLPVFVSRQIHENLRGIHAPDSAGPAMALGALGARALQGGSSTLIRKCSNCLDVRAGPQRRLSAKELMLSKCGAGEDSWESLELQEDQTSPS